MKADKHWIICSSRKQNVSVLTNKHTQNTTEEKYLPGWSGKKISMSMETGLLWVCCVLTAGLALCMLVWVGGWVWLNLCLCAKLAKGCVGVSYVCVCFKPPHLFCLVTFFCGTLPILLCRELVLETMCFFVCSVRVRARTCFLSLSEGKFPAPGSSSCPQECP